MIISPPFLRDRDATQSDADWVAAMMPENEHRGFPLNGSASWHGGIHISHTDRLMNGQERVEKVRAIADGVVVSFRKPSTSARRDAFPLNYNGKTDDGFVLLKHETAIGSGDSSSITFYSLYMHLRDNLEPTIKVGARIWRKDPLGLSGMVDGTSAFHFQIFCDDDNLIKLTGRTTPGLSVDSDGRTDTIYGDIHFYLPTGTVFYDRMPENNTADVSALSAIYTNSEPLYVRMSFAKGDCSMVTLRKASASNFVYEEVGQALVNTDACNVDGEDKKYEYNLYATSKRLYPQNPSAGYELLRFGRVINIEQETLAPANAPLWRTINYPGGTGVVNLALASIKKFSDADFPHWAGWWMIDDDTDQNSQGNSPLIADILKSGCFETLCQKLVCHFPLEWNAATFEQRYSWLKMGDNVISAMSETDYDKLKEHASALCFAPGELGAGRLWHFHPTAFIAHFRKCSWLSKRELKQIVPLHSLSGQRWSAISYNDEENSTANRIHISLNKTMQKYLITGPLRITCFLGNAIQETAWLSTTHEFYTYTERDHHTGQVTRRYNVWYYPWHGRGLLQLTNPENYFNYFSFRGVNYPLNIKNRLSSEYDRLYHNGAIRYTDNHLGDEANTDLPGSVIEWRNNVDKSDYEPTDSAGFYWCSSKMAQYSDAEHELERCAIGTSTGIKIYYRSQAFWKASAAVNLPGRVGDTHYRGLNGFDARCCVYGSAISVLTEMKFPNSNREFVLETPESNQLRR